MAKYELELTNEQAEAIYRMARGNPDFGITWAEKFKEQVPIPVPTRVGAIVRAQQLGGDALYMRWAHDSTTYSPWIQVGNHEQPYRTDEIGRIVEVLSEGTGL